MATPQVHIVHPPRPAPHSEAEPGMIAYVDKFRELRLYALSESPESFGSTYEIEAERSRKEFYDRLRNDKAHHFWLVDREVLTSSGVADFKQLADAQWLGSLVLLGPLEPDAHRTVTARNDPLLSVSKSIAQNSSDGQDQVQTESNAMLFHLNGMFIAPSHRRKGLGRALIEAALAKARSLAAASGKTMRCSVLVNSGNDSAKILYERAGFKVVGKETYVQVPRGRLGETEPSEKEALHLILE